MKRTPARGRLGGEKETMRIKDLRIDYENRILIINGMKVDFAVDLVLHRKDGWNEGVLLNPGCMNQQRVPVRLAIDLTGIDAYTELRNIEATMRRVLAEMNPGQSDQGKEIISNTPSEHEGH